MKKTSNLVLIAAVIAVVGYALTAVIFQIITGVELSATLTGCWFSFWGVEMAALAAIKTSKVKHHTDGESPAEGEVDKTEGVE